MECRVDNDLLQSYIENDLEKIEMIILEEHLKKCKKCRSEITHLKLLMFEIGELHDDKLDFPEELEMIKENVLTEVFDKKYTKSKNSLIKNVTRFRKYVPKLNPFGDVIGKTTKYLKTAPYKVLKFSFKRIQKGF